MESVLLRELSKMQLGGTEWVWYMLTSAQMESELWPIIVSTRASRISAQCSRQSRYHLDPYPKQLVTAFSSRRNISFPVSESIIIPSRPFQQPVVFAFIKSWLFFFPGTLFPFYSNLCLSNYNSFIKKKKTFIYLSVPGLICSTQDLRSLLWHARSFFLSFF